MKIALVHDWLTGMRGGEKVLEAFCELFPEAEIFTLFHFKGAVSSLIESHEIHTSFLQKAATQKNYRYLLPLMPAAVESFSLTEYELVISLSHCVSKGVRVREDATHVCYCFTPMRYIWDMKDAYFNAPGSNPLARAIMYFITPFLRRWDISTSDKVDYFIANSQNVRKRIEKYYKRQSSVIFSPVDTEKFDWRRKSEDFYLVVSAFAPYKRVDLAIETFNDLGLSLKIIGSGQDEKRLKRMARGNIEFLGWQTDDVVVDYYARCRALIFPGEEDSGIVPLEAMASGKPVIAYAKGGALETVVDAVTGILFYKQTRSALKKAVMDMEKNKSNFMPLQIKQHAAKFDKAIFKDKIRVYADNIINNAKKI
jgi:glycosyltransferase involved in cell wall biosynthesis